MSITRFGINSLKFSAITNVSALFSELQNEVYALLPERVKNRVPNGRSLNLSKETLGFNPGEYPYKSSEELRSNHQTYSDNAVCLVYEALLILNQSEILNITWDQSYRVTLLAAITKKVGFSNLNAARNYLSSLAEKDKWAPSVVDETSFKLALMMRMVITQILSKNLIPLADKSIKVMAGDGLRALRHDLNVNLYQFQAAVIADMDKKIQKIEGACARVSQLVKQAEKNGESSSNLLLQLKAITQSIDNYQETLASLQEVNDVLADWGHEEKAYKNPNQTICQHVVTQLKLLGEMISFIHGAISKLASEEQKHASVLNEEKSVGMLEEQPAVAVSAVSTFHEVEPRFVGDSGLDDEYSQAISVALVDDLEQEEEEEKLLPQARAIHHDGPAMLPRGANLPARGRALSEEIYQHAGALDGQGDELIEAKGSITHRVLHDQRNNARVAIASPAFTLILKKLNAHSWASAINQFLFTSQLKEISLDMYAFSKSILELLGNNGKKNATDADLLPMLIELLPKNKNYLLELSVKLNQLMDIQRDRSELGNHMALLHIAIQTKIEIFDKPELDNLPEDNQRLRVIYPRLNATYQLNQNICRLLEGTKAYMEQLSVSIEQALAKQDLNDHYYNVQSESVEIDRETGERHVIVRHKNYLEAVMDDYVSEEKDNIVKELAKKDPLFDSLLTKYRIMSELENKLTAPRKSAKERFVDYYEHLDKNSELLKKNRDSHFTTFFKLAAFIFATVLPIIGNLIAYSRLFVSKGSRYVSYAAGKRHVDMNHDHDDQFHQTIKRPRI
ncbi:MAG: hypothetical protein P4M14_05215 [Gammaproteobacteria bacterium]|nr:hypothetical protein [Gammaproteobacteria bacterium]